MMHVPHEPGESAEWAALYVSGALEEGQVREFQQHMDACAACRDEVSRLDGVVAALFHELTPVAPDARIRERLMERIAEEARSSLDADPSASAAAEPAANPQVWRDWESDAPAGLLTKHADERAWEETGIPGITARRLYVDRARNEIAMLVRMAAGTRYPRHRHDGPEQCYVVAGDLHVGETVLRAGDYQRAEPDSTHVVQWTEGGCELFLISSLTDELV